MSIAAPTPRNAPLPNPRAAAAELPVVENGAIEKYASRMARVKRTARRLPRSRSGQRIAGWFKRWRERGRQSSLRQALAPCAVSCVVHAALVGGLALCTLAPRDRNDALELAVELHQLRPPPAMAARELQHDLPESLRPAGDSANHVHLHAGAAIDPVVWAPNIEAVMLASSAAVPLRRQRFDRELAPDQHAIARIVPPPALPAVPEPPVKKAAEGRRTVISLPAEFKGLGGMFAGRQPALRPLLIKQLGGTDETEAAVKRGLEWLKKHQQPDGRWCLHAFGTLPDCRGQCTHPGIISDSSGTALALLPFLAAGSTHLEGEHSMVVARGLAWLVDHQLNSGGWGDTGIVRMYAHGQATIALAEAYAMTHDPRLLKPLTKAIEVIAQYQQPGGGWRYELDQEGDNSVTGWQLMALRSAQAGGIEIPQTMFSKAMRFLNTMQQDPDHGLFRYGRNRPVTETMTAEGLLSREYGGWSYSNAALKVGVAELLKNHLPRRERPNMYYWYYGTQTMHHVGGKSWETWNETTRALLVDLQVKEGHMAGSWTPKEQHDQAGGRLYMTALATCTLEVYYRHMPLYARYSFGEEDSKAAAK